MRNFHDHQSRAQRSSTSLLGALMATVGATVLVTSVALTIVVAIVWIWFLGEAKAHEGLVLETPFSIGLILFWLACITVGVALSIGLVSLMMIRELRDGGGARLAEKLGGVLLSRTDTRGDIKKQQLLNIVEEMAIASRIAPPTTYILEGEWGINAFAAGFEADDAVIALTEGALQQLDRDQLQGVVAHEFSHIVHGDIGINLRLLGVLHGVLGVSLLAEWMIAIGSNALEIPNGQDERRGHPLALLVGILLWPVGVIGLFFSMLLKAGVSRQREFLADASAVEFTRNPEGLAGALKIIAGHASGSRVTHPASLELSHLFFANGGRRGRFFRWLNSHPSLVDRIQRLDPNWEAKMVDTTSSGVTMAKHDPTFGAVTHLQDGSAGNLHTSVDPREAGSQALFADVLRGLVISPDDAIANLPLELRRFCENSEGAPFVLLALKHLFVLTESGAVENTQPMRSTLGSIDADSTELVRVLADHIQPLQDPDRLIVLDLAVGSLSGSAQGVDVDIRKLLEAEGGRSNVGGIWCWTWQKVVSWLLQKGSSKTTTSRKSKQECLGACEILLSAICRSGNEAGMLEYAFQRATSALGAVDLVLRPTNECTLKYVDAAVERLQNCEPGVLAEVLNACVTGITTDREIELEEALLLRGISCGLGFAPVMLNPRQAILPGV
jgi:Zn-dependent protease with chaperone function